MTPGLRWCGSVATACALLSACDVGISLGSFADQGGAGAGAGGGSAGASAGGGASAGAGGSAPTKMTGCVAVPNVCGFPDGTNTGPAPGVARKRVPEDVVSGAGWHWSANDGVIVVDGAGAVLRGFMTGTIEVYASGVVIGDNEIISDGQNSWGVGLRAGSDVTIEDNEIHGTGAGKGRLGYGVKDLGSAVGVRVLRNEIYYVAVGTDVGQGAVEDNYIHDAAYDSDVEKLSVKLISSDGGDGASLTIRHNTVLNQLTTEAAVLLGTGSGRQANCTIDDNLFAGGEYTVYAGGSGTSNIVITGNHFSTVYSLEGGASGPVVGFDVSGTGNRWSGNLWDDGQNVGRAVSP